MTCKYSVMMSELQELLLTQEDRNYLEWKENYDPDLTDEDKDKITRLYEEHIGYGRE